MNRRELERFKDGVHDHLITGIYEPWNKSNLNKEYKLGWDFGKNIKETKMTGNKQLNKQLQNYFLNFCLVISILMVGVIIYSKVI
jgi:hypothetical protein